MRAALLSSILAFAFAASIGCSSTTVGHGMPDGGSFFSNDSPPNVYCTGYGSSCTCGYAGSVQNTAFECSAASVTNGVCCADYGWPGTNLLCRCESYTCKQTGPSASDCRCGTSVSGNLTTCSGNCCQDDYGCECGADVTCAVGTKVASCSAAQQTCPTEKQKVNACL